MKALRSDSVAARVVAFFERNPHELLTADDVAEKFGFDVGARWAKLHRARELGLLGFGFDPTLGNVYAHPSVKLAPPQRGYPGHRDRWSRVGARA